MRRGNESSYGHPAKRHYGHRRGTRGSGKNRPSGFRTRDRSLFAAVASGVSRRTRRTHASHRVAGRYASSRTAAGPCISRAPVGSMSCHDSATSFSGMRAAYGRAASSSRLRRARRSCRSSLATNLAAARQNGQPPSNIKSGRAGGGTSPSHDRSNTKRSSSHDASGSTRGWDGRPACQSGVTDTVRTPSSRGTHTTASPSRARQTRSGAVSGTGVCQAGTSTNSVPPRPQGHGQARKGRRRTLRS